MLVVGGTYAERTAEPATEFVFGSGLRAATAFWCETRTLPLPLARGFDPDSLRAGLALAPAAEVVPVYLAGPFFTAGERWLVNLSREALGNLGAAVFSPLHDVGAAGNGDGGVAERDLEGLRSSRSVLALLDGSDAGTLYEVGYAAAKGIPVVGFAGEPRSGNNLMARGTAAALTDDLSTAVYLAIWAGMHAR